MGDIATAVEEWARSIYTKAMEIADEAASIAMLIPGTATGDQTEVQSVLEEVERKYNASQ